MHARHLLAAAVAAIAVAMPVAACAEGEVVRIKRNPSALILDAARVNAGADVIYVSGQLPMVDGKLTRTGKVGADVTPEEGAELARTCALNALAAIDSLVGLGRLVKIVKLTGFVASAEGFTGQPTVINGASDLFGEVLGELGRHARSAVGVAELPLGAPVEVEVIAEVA